jgi:hypothetical protein
MNNQRAESIVEGMAKLRGVSMLEVLKEWRKYQVDGEASHFWPDENTACRTLLLVDVTLED